MAVAVREYGFDAYIKNNILNVAIVNNCHAVQMFGRMGPLAARHAAELLGLPRPDILRNMKSDDMMLALGQDDPRIVARPNYLEDDELYELASPNPFYGGGAAKQTRRLSDIAESEPAAPVQGQLDLFKKRRRRRGSSTDDVPF